MRKIDLHEDIILSYFQDIPKFSNRVDPAVINSSNAGGLPNYIEADLQIVWAAILPYSMNQNQTNPNFGKMEFDKQKLTEYWKKYEELRKMHNIYLILDSQYLEETKYIDYRLNFVYHLKGADEMGSIEDFEKLRNAGIRSIQPVWQIDNNIAHCYKSTQGGLTEYGKDVLEYLNNNKMIIDTANMNYQSMIETYRFTKKPIMNSHTNILGLYKHSRNVSDEFLDLIERSDGLIGLTLTSEYMKNPDQTASIQDYIEQIKYVKNKVGDDNIAFGSGYHSPHFKKMVGGFENISSLQILEQKIIQEFGYKFAERFFWENAYRFLLQTI